MASWPPRAARRPGPAVVLAAVVALLAVTGCGSRTNASHGAGTSAAATPPGAAAQSAAPSGGGASAGSRKLLVVVLENESASTAFPQMPFLSSLARTYGRVEGYRAVTHPSLPNYLAMAGGSTFGVGDDRGPEAHPIAGQSIFGQAVAAGKSARVYAEGMAGNCEASSSGGYAVRHTGWPYFVEERAECRRFDVPMGSPAGGALAADVAGGSLPDLGWAIPDLCDDGHDCPLRTADGWLKGWLGAIMAGPDFSSGRLVVVVTFDEGDGSDQVVPFVVVARDVRGRVVSPAGAGHYALTRLADDLLGAPPLRQAASAPDLRAALGL